MSAWLDATHVPFPYATLCHVVDVGRVDVLQVTPSVE